MDPKGYPACVLFYFAIAVSFLAKGRAALRARDFARTRTSTVENPWRSKVVASGRDVPSLPSLTAKRKPRPPSLTTPQFRPSDPAELFLAPQAFVTPLPPSLAHSVPANFSLPITFEPAAASTGQAVQYVGHGKGMTVLRESGGIEIAVGNAPGANASLGSVKLQLLSAASQQTGAMTILLSIGLVACFGSGTAPLPPVGTPTGTYTITVTGTFTGTGGSTTRNVQVTLAVQSFSGASLQLRSHSTALRKP
jgi:hypothetical protein